MDNVYELRSGQAWARSVLRENTQFQSVFMSPFGRGFIHSHCSVSSCYPTTSKKIQDENIIRPKHRPATWGWGWGGVVEGGYCCSADPDQLYTAKPAVHSKRLLLISTATSPPAAAAVPTSAAKSTELILQPATNSICSGVLYKNLSGIPVNSGTDISSL